MRPANVRYGPLADIARRSAHVSFTPETGHWSACGECLPACRRNFKKWRADVETKIEDLGETIWHGRHSCRANAMRDWALALAPLGGVLYFLIYPDQFRELTGHLLLFIQWLGY